MKYTLSKGLKNSFLVKENECEWKDNFLTFFSFSLGNFFFTSLSSFSLEWSCIKNSVKESFRNKNKGKQDVIIERIFFFSLFFSVFLSHFSSFLFFLLYFFFLSKSHSFERIERFLLQFVSDSYLWLPDRNNCKQLIIPHKYFFCWFFHVILSWIEKERIRKRMREQKESVSLPLLPSIHSIWSQFINSSRIPFSSLFSLEEKE